MNDPLQQTLETALQHHGAGRLNEAANAYQQILQDDPEQPEALHLLGVVAHQVGQDEQAVELIGRAIAIKPGFAAAHNNLGIALKDLGLINQAIAAYHQALTCQPDFAAALNNLGVAFRTQGRLAEATISFRESLSIEADAEVYNNLGNTLLLMNEPDRAIANHRRALALVPDYPGALNCLAEALKQQGDMEQAVLHFEKSLAIRPDAKIYTNLGCLLSIQGRPEQALASHDQAVATEPDYAEAHYNRGNALRELDRLEEAAESYRRAAASKPDLAEAWHNLGVVLHGLGRLDEAINSYRQALAIRADYAEAHRGLGHVQLMIGDFAAGWQNYHWRWKAKDYRQARRNYQAAEWDGGNFSGKTLFLYREQGLGDFIQFARYVPLAAALGGRVIVEAPGELMPLFATMEGADIVIETGQQPDKFDLHAPLLDLPMLLGTSMETIPAGASYITPSLGLVEKWRHRLAAYKGLRVGLAWAGNADQLNDKNRSMDPAMLRPLTQLPGLSLFSLQVGRDGEAAQIFSDQVTDLAPQLTTFAETAAAMSNLDLIVTVDTAPAHLAGAMGLPVWTLLCFMPDWRWFLDRDDCPWYPSMRLFRQHPAGNWSGAIEQVCVALAAQRDAQ